MIIYQKIPTSCHLTKQLQNHDVMWHIDIFYHYLVIVMIKYL
jgi:hypothetical protein